MLKAIPPSILAAQAESTELQRAFSAVGISNPLHSARDGNELFELLLSPENALRPGLILLDFELAPTGGLEALKRIRADRRHQKIPVILLSSSKSAADVDAGYVLGANSVFNKPSDFQGLVALVKLLKAYWLESAQLPRE